MLKRMFWKLRLRLGWRPSLAKALKELERGGPEDYEQGICVNAQLLMGPSAPLFRVLQSFALVNRAQPELKTSANTTGKAFWDQTTEAGKYRSQALKRFIDYVS